MATYLLCQLCMLLAISALARGGPSCFKCDLQVHPAACQEITRCGDHEDCFTEKVLNNLGAVQFTSGCKPKADCVKTVRKRSAVTACSECCNTTACNAKLCGAPDPTNGSRLWCASCSNQQLPEYCDRVDRCSSDQQCSVTLQDVFGMQTYSMGCTLNGTCLGKTLANDRVECCVSHMCNTNLALVSPDIYTPPPPTTTTPPPSAATAHINESAVSYVSQNQPNEKLQIFCDVGGFPVPNVTWYFVPDVTSSAPATTAAPGNFTATSTTGTTTTPGTTTATCTCPTGTLGVTTNTNVTATANATTTPGANTTAASTTTVATTAAPTGQPITSGINTLNGLSTLDIASPNASVAGQYVCRAVNPMGTVDSNTTVSFSALPRIDGPANDSVSANVRDEVLLPCDVTGVPTPTVEWTLPANAGGVEKLANGSLLIHNAHGDNTGDYRCTANNTAGVTEKNFTLTVTDPSTPTCPTPAAVTVAATTPPPTTTSPQTCPPSVTCPPPVTCPPAPSCPTVNCPLPVTCPPPVTCPTVLTSLLTSPTPCPTQAALLTTTAPPSTTTGLSSVNLTAAGSLMRNAQAGPHRLHCEANASFTVTVMWERLEHDFDHTNSHVYLEEPLHGNLMITKQPHTVPLELTGVYNCSTPIAGSGSAYYVLYYDIPPPLDCSSTFDSMGQVTPGNVFRSYCGPCQPGFVAHTHITWSDLICSSAIALNVISDTGGEVTWLFRKNNEVSFLVADHTHRLTFVP